jgi:hypothetical protein
MHPILENAVQSIQLGVEDAQNDEARRILSAVRNITAGVLLLFKEKLRQLSPPDSEDVLIKQRFRMRRSKDGVLTMVGAGHKTVDAQQIRDRFDDLDIETDWKRVEAIVNARNEVEHYSSSRSPAILKQLIYDSFLVISDFITKQLNEQPAQLLGAATWGVLLEQSQVYEVQLRESKIALEKIKWPTEIHERVAADLRCPECSSEILIPKNPDASDPQMLEFVCRGCGHNAEYCEIVENAVGECFAGESYIAVKDGGEPPVEECWECGRETFVFELGECIACGVTPKHATCPACHTGLSIQEQGLGGICSRCHYLLMKDD